jgi:hypothetical protein
VYLRRKILDKAQELREKKQECPAPGIQGASRALGDDFHVGKHHRILNTMPKTCKDILRVMGGEVVSSCRSCRI